MSTGKKLVALAVLLVAGFGLIYAIEQTNLTKSEKENAGPELANGLLKEPVQKDGKTYLVPSNRLFEYGVDVPELHDPKYISVSSADEILADNVEGIDIEVDGQHYFYSYQILNWHQVVRARFDSVQLYVTHDPLTYSDRVYLEEDRGLEHADLVYDNNAILKDKNGNLWSQQRGIQIVGDNAGDELTTYPYRSMTWLVWKELYPNGQALSADTGFVRDYTRHPFGAYDDNEFIYFPLSTINTDFVDKWVVDGVTMGEESIAFLRKIILGLGVANETLGEVPVVAFYDQDLELTRTYYATPTGGEALTFTYDFKNDVFTDDQTGSTWTANGVATRGDLEGQKLTPVASTQQFWFSWTAQHPDTKIGNADRITTVDEPAEGIDIDLRELE